MLQTHETAQPDAKVMNLLFASRMTRKTLLSPVLTFLLMAVWILVRFFGPSAGEHMHPAALLLAGAKVNELLAEGQFWRLITAIFLHTDPPHLLVNAAGVFLLVQICENALDAATTFVIFVFGGAAGFALSWAVGAGPSLGSSGSAFALLGALMAFTLTHRRVIPATFRKVFLLATAAWLAVSVGLGSARQGIDHAAHAGGMLTGFLLGMILNRKPQSVCLDPVKPPPHVPPLAGLAAVCTVAALVMGAASLQRVLPVPDPGRKGVVWAESSIDIPADWKHGRMIGSECRPEPLSTPQQIIDTGTLCLKDAWNSVLIFGRRTQLVPGVAVDPSMTVRWGRRTVASQTENSVTTQVIPFDLENAIALISYDVLADRYSNLVNRIAGSAKFGKKTGL